MRPTMPRFQSTPTNIDIQALFELIIRDGRPPGKWKIVVDGGNGVADLDVFPLEMMCTKDVDIQILPLYCTTDGNSLHILQTRQFQKMYKISKPLYSKRKRTWVLVYGDGDRLALNVNGKHVFGDHCWAFCTDI